MKKFSTLIVIAAFTITVSGQVPGKMSYQAVVRNTAGELIPDQAVGMKISIIHGSADGTVIFSETYSPNPQTNSNGLLTIEIGAGTPVTGTFTGINWSEGPYFLKMEIDPEGGSNYTISGTSQLLSVPYALHAVSAENVFSGSYDDLTNKPVLFDGTWSNLTGTPAGFSDGIDNVDDTDNSITNEIQSLSISGTVLTLSNGGGSVTLPSSGGGDNWGTQTVVSNTTLNGEGTIASPLAVANSIITPSWSNVQGIPAGFADGLDNIDDADNSITNEIQALSLSGTVLTLSNGGGTVTLPSSGGGDNWGTQTVVSNTTLNGEGTIASPLAVANSIITPSWSNVQGIPAGFADGTDNVNDADISITNEIQTLSIAGSDLSLSNGGGTVAIPGDNWGTQAVVTDATMTGNGTSSTPLKIAQQSATTGMVLKWNGSTWVPDVDLAGQSFSIPYSGAASTTEGAVLMIDNIGSGDAIIGVSETGQGIVGIAQGTDFEPGVFGFASSATGSTVAVRGYANSPQGFAGYFDGGTFYIGGNTGIGTSVPSTKLDINGQIRIRGGSPGEGKVLTSDATGLASWQTSSEGSLWQSNNTSIYYNGGHVGIGVDNPASKLHVYDDEFSQIRVQSGTTDALLYLQKGVTHRFASVIFQENNDTKFQIGLLTRNSFWISTDHTTLNGLEISENGNAKLSDNLDIAGSITIRGGSPGAGYVLSSDNTGLASWVPMNDNDWSISGSNIYSAVSGNVGIGNTNPAYKLDVKANSRIQLSKTTGQWVAMRTDGTLLDFSFSGSSLAIKSESDDEHILLNPASNNKVGIRTWLPMYTLDVVGDIRATGSVYYGGTSGNANGTVYTKPDYVFEETYNHMTTEEVCEYLLSEKHLPWITSAREEKEEAGNVVDMTRMAFETVETVENLQLQIIEMNKVIKALNKKIMLQQAQIERLENLNR